MSMRRWRIQEISHSPIVVARRKSFHPPPQSCTRPSCVRSNRILWLPYSGGQSVFDSNPGFSASFTAVYVWPLIYKLPGIRDMPLSEIPVFGGVLNAGETYIRQTGRIVRHPIRFASPERFALPSEFSNSFRYLVSAVVLMYLINIPVFIKHDESMSQAFFILSFLSRYIVYFTISHFVLRVLGSDKPLVATFALQSYLIGFFAPASELLLLPFTLAVGPISLTAGFSQLPKMSLQAEQALSDDFVVITYLGFSLLNLCGLFVCVVWFARVHELTKLRTITGLLLGVFVSFAVLEFLFYPIWTRASDFIERLVAFV
jgi:hypothetical protein